MKAFIAIIALTLAVAACGEGEPDLEVTASSGAPAGAEVPDLSITTAMSSTKTITSTTTTTSAPPPTPPPSCESRGSDVLEVAASNVYLDRSLIPDLEWQRRLEGELDTKTTPALNVVLRSLERSYRFCLAELSYKETLAEESDGIISSTTVQGRRDVVICLDGVNSGYVYGYNDISFVSVDVLSEAAFACLDGLQGMSAPSYRPEEFGTVRRPPRQ